MSGAAAFAQCDDCRHYWPVDALKEPRELAQRVEGGGPQPAGGCPECGALAYLLEDEAPVDAPACRNCGEPHGALGACLFGAAAQVVNDRDELSSPITAEDIAQIDVDAFWSAADDLIEWVGNRVAWRRACTRTARDTR